MCKCLRVGFGEIEWLCVPTIKLKAVKALILFLFYLGILDQASKYLSHFQAKMSKKIVTLFETSWQNRTPLGTKMVKNYLQCIPYFRPFDTAPTNISYIWEQPPSGSGLHDP